MKKQVLIVFTGAMEIGGIERSLLGLLEAFNYEEYSVDLFLYGHHGALYPLIDQRVNILPEVKELAFLRESFVMKLKHGCFYSIALRIRDEFKSRFLPVDFDVSWAQIMRKCVPRLNKQYDLALGFFRPFDLLVEKVDAHIKIGWVHTDYTKAGEDLKSLAQDYERMDYIVAVSDKCAESFRMVFPQFSSKLLTIGNILSETFIRNEADKMNVTDEMLDDGSIKLLSIGRFCDAKNFDNVPFICKAICAQGINVKWYLIGFGCDEQLIRQKILEAGMQEHVIILGKKENPYPYIKACDLYIQPSRYEGKCVSVVEAQILRKPVVITDYITSGSQLKDGYDGVIVPMNNEECANGIVDVIQDRRLQQRLIANMQKNNYTNVEEIKKIYQLI